MPKRMTKSCPKDGTIDAGLLVLRQIAQPGQTFSHTEISIACGCHRGYISLMEKAALRKLRRMLSRNTNRLARVELETHLR